MSKQPTSLDSYRKVPRKSYTGGSDGGEPPMSQLEARVEHLERDVTDIKVSLARIEAKLDAVDTRFDAMNTRFDAVVTWKSAFVGLAVLLTGLAGIAWWVVQQILSPLLQAVGGA